MTNTVRKLGALRCATIICQSLRAAIDAYQRGLGFRVLEEGLVSSDRAESWGAPACAGAAFAVLGPPSDETTYVRFIEDPHAPKLTPYTTLGWAALEFSVASSDQAVKSLSEAGFTVVGPAQDLAFSEGALRAGQVHGPFGEVLYLTQVNAQLDHYVLPTTGHLADKMFIVILGVPSVDDVYTAYNRDFGMLPKEPFDAEVPFIATFQGLPQDHLYHVGCLELTDKSYVEVDEMNSAISNRPSPEDRLPPGICMITVEVASLEPFVAQSKGPALTETGAPYGRQSSLLITGPFGELIELVETP